MTDPLVGQGGWDDDVPAAVPVDPATLLGKDGSEKLVEVVHLLSGGLGYQGVVKWLAMWPDVDSALREARRAAGPMVAT